MSNFPGANGAAAMSPPAFRADALAGVRTRRILALCVDLIIVSIIALVLWLALLVMTLGLSLFLLPPIYPLVAFFYNGLTVSGRKMGTPGMRMMDLEMRLYDSGGRVPFINAAAHALFFYLSWMLPPIFLVTLVDQEKRCVHDMLAGVVVLRRL
ncbi:RDD family protein [Methylocapsa sp. S129]|uniref:RDD family protein n=1 Tax=Methylocapsa sp. S129 TaxID=1641869 RepID=UPI00131C13A4|nr:RDD family protein [Methylocapsa sp. S129]